MTTLRFENLTFREEEDHITGTFLKLFLFTLSKTDLNSIGQYTVEKQSITFHDVPEKRARRKFNELLARAFTALTNRLNNNPTTYIHEHSGIPLIGANSFGIVDRDTSAIEIKPITSCNLNCTFCSVDEGIDTKKTADFVVQKDYLVQEFKKLIQFKQTKPIYAYINVHGEPFLYEPLISLIQELNNIPDVIVSVITNGTFLTEEKIDRLVKAGLKRINISLNAFSKKLAKELAGTHYNVERLKEIIKYAAEKLEIVVAPVYLAGINDKEIEEIIAWTASIQKEGFPLLGIQNFLEYKRGRNPVKGIPMEEFKQKIRRWEEQYAINLQTDEFYKIVKTKPLPKPFNKGEIVKAEIVSNDRCPHQKIAVCKNRVISVLQCHKEKGTVKVKIVRDKHNIFAGVPV